MGKIRKMFGYHTGQEFINGTKEYELNDGDPDEEFLKNPDHFIDPIYVIDAKPVIDLLTSAYWALREAFWLKASIQKLIDENPNRSWVLEKDVHKWSSFQQMEKVADQISESGLL